MYEYVELCTYVCVLYGVSEYTILPPYTVWCCVLYGSTNCRFSSDGCRTCAMYTVCAVYVNALTSPCCLCCCALYHTWRLSYMNEWSLFLSGVPGLRRSRLARMACAPCKTNEDGMVSKTTKIDGWREDDTHFESRHREITRYGGTGKCF